jgi:hypothetical protein
MKDFSIYRTTPLKSIILSFYNVLGGIEAGFAGTVWVPFGDNCLVTNGPKPNHTIKQVTDLVKVLNRGPDAHEYEDSSSNASDGM